MSEQVDKRHARIAKLRARAKKAKARRRRNHLDSSHRHVREQLDLQAFADKHQLGCFKCGQRQQVIWSKAGRRQTGKPWIICAPCVKKGRSSGTL